MKHNISFLFGAGAEIGEDNFQMPNGNDFCRDSLFMKYKEPNEKNYKAQIRVFKQL